MTDTEPAPRTFAIPDCPPDVTRVTYDDEQDGRTHTADLVAVGLMKGLWAVDDGGYADWNELLARGPLTDATPAPSPPPTLAEDVETVRQAMDPFSVPGSIDAMRRIEAALSCQNGDTNA